MTVFEVKGQLFEIGPGVCGSEAEAKVTGEDGKDVYVFAQCFEGCYDYSVRTESAFGKQNETDAPGGEVLEEYEELSETKGSKYHKVFGVLEKMLKLIEG